MASGMEWKCGSGISNKSEELVCSLACMLFYIISMASFLMFCKSLLTCHLFFSDVYPDYLKKIVIILLCSSGFVTLPSNIQYLLTMYTFLLWLLFPPSYQNIIFMKAGTFVLFTNVFQVHRSAWYIIGTQ